MASHRSPKRAGRAERMVAMFEIEGIVSFLAGWLASVIGDLPAWVAPLVSWLLELALGAF